MTTDSPSLTTISNKLSSKRLIRIPHLLAAAIAVAILTFWLEGPSVATIRLYSPAKSPDDPLDPLRQRLLSALRILPQYQHEHHVWQSAKSVPLDPKDGGDAKLWGAWNSWIDMNPGWERHFIEDDMMEHHIKILASVSLPEILSTYHALPKIVLKSDFLRYIILYMHGGVWTDIDTQCTIPISAWVRNCTIQASELNDVGLIVGTEFDHVNWLDRDLQMAQYTFAAGRGHPVLREIIARIVEHPIINPDFENILKWTGPRQWTDAITDHLNATIPHFGLGMIRDLEQPVHMSNICIGPVYAFGSGRGTVDEDDSRIWSRHFFQGNWVET